MPAASDAMTSDGRWQIIRFMRFEQQAYKQYLRIVVAMKRTRRRGNSDASRRRARNDVGTAIVYPVSYREI